MIFNMFNNHFDDFLSGFRDSREIREKYPFPKRPIFEVNKQSGFFDLPVDKTCRHSEHQPPSHIHIPQGKGYRHVCPGCGNVVDIIPQQITL